MQLHKRSTNRLSETRHRPNFQACRHDQYQQSQTPFVILCPRKAVSSWYGAQNNDSQSACDIHLFAKKTRFAATPRTATAIVTDHVESFISTWQPAGEHTNTGLLHFCHTRGRLFRLANKRLRYEHGFITAPEPRHS